MDINRALSSALCLILLAGSAQGLEYGDDGQLAVHEVKLPMPVDQPVLEQKLPMPVEQTPIPPITQNLIPEMLDQITPVKHGRRPVPVGVEWVGPPLFGIPDKYRHGEFEPGIDESFEFGRYCADVTCTWGIVLWRKTPRR